jgi:hypothetical protein
MMTAALSCCMLPSNIVSAAMANRSARVIACASP